MNSGMVLDSVDSPLLGRAACYTLYKFQSRLSQKGSMTALVQMQNREPENRIMRAFGDPVRGSYAIRYCHVFPVHSRPTLTANGLLSAAIQTLSPQMAN